MPTINRMVSQTGREAGWRKDKQALLASLADYQFLTFNDLDYFDDNKTILATFPNFNTDDIIQSYTIDYWASDEDEPWGILGGHARVYINIDGDDAPVVSSMRQSLTFASEGYTDYIPAVDVVTNKTIEYAIKDVKTLTLYTRGLSVDIDGIATGWTYEVEGENSEDLPAEHDHFARAADYPPYVFITSASEKEQEWIDSGWYYEVELSWLVLKRDIDLNATDNLLGRKGLDWHEGLENQFDPLTWQIIYPAWTDVDIVINEARFAKVDKQFRWE